MKASRLLSLLMLLSIPLMAHAKPEYQDYPAKVYRGVAHPVTIDQHTRHFKTQFMNPNGQAINFAGHYVINEFACGTDACTALLWVDVKTGKGRFFGPRTFTGCYSGDEYISPEFHYRANSRLFIAIGKPEGSANDHAQCQVHYYVAHNGMLKLLETAPFTTAPLE